MRDLDTVFEKLGLSAFRSRFRLGDKDRAYFEGRGAAAIREHAQELIARRLAPAEPLKDGRQTPWRGHPGMPQEPAAAPALPSGTGSRPDGH